jgi:CheY-like chemotaxis protein/chemotaxis protein CheY-P-specific phosphatase CheC
MTLKVLICDDSALARRQMARALPSDWDMELSFATNGSEALEAIKAGKSELLFLDLNMPVMNGYEVLDAIRSEDLPTMVLVVSGDIQAEAHQRVMAKGALAFIKKPVTASQIQHILQQYGLLELAANKTSQSERGAADALPTPAFHEALAEVVNVAMGQAGSHLGELLNSFVRLPVPRVFFCNYQELPSKLPFYVSHPAKPWDDNEDPSHGFSGISHGFRGNGVAGEGILLLRNQQMDGLMRLLDRSEKKPLDQMRSVPGLLSDLSELLVGACLKGISQQLDLEFNHSYPALLGQGEHLETLLDTNAHNNPVLAITITYHLGDPDLDCLLLLLFTAESVSTLQHRVELLISDDERHN